METARVEIAVDTTDEARIKSIRAAIGAYFSKVDDGRRWWMDAAGVIERDGGAPPAPGTVAVTVRFDIWADEIAALEAKSFAGLVKVIREASGDADCKVWQVMGLSPWTYRSSDHEGDIEDDEKEY